MSNETPTQQPATVTFLVEGMTCGSCVRHVGEALSERFGEIEHAVDLAGRTLTVAYDPARVTEAAIASAMDEAGYPVTKLA